MASRGQNNSVIYSQERKPAFYDENKLKFLNRYSEKVGIVTDQIQPVYESTTT